MAEATRIATSKSCRPGTESNRRHGGKVMRFGGNAAGITERQTAALAGRESPSANGEQYRSIGKSGGRGRNRTADTGVR